MYPEEDDEGDGQYLPQEDTDIVILLLVADGAVEVRFVFLLLQEVAQAFARRSFGDNHRVTSHTGGVLQENILHVLGFDIGFHGIVIIAHDFADVSVLHVLLEFIIGDFLGVQVLVSGK